MKKIRIDLLQTPWFHWRWKVAETIKPPGATLHETSKLGDDFAARVYLIIDGGLRFWKTRALNYVWANRQANGAVWANPYAGDKAMMLALRNSSQPPGIWVNESRNVYQDLKQVFGEEIRYVDAVAIMTDTDNTGGSARAAYSDLYFSAH